VLAVGFDVDVHAEREESVPSEGLGGMLSLQFVTARCPSSITVEAEIDGQRLELNSFLHSF
jgi:hypothetical protein